MHVFHEQSLGRHCGPKEPLEQRKACLIQGKKDNTKKPLKICTKFGDTSMVSGLRDLVHRRFLVLNIQILVVQDNALVDTISDN